MKRDIDGLPLRDLPVVRDAPVSDQLRWKHPDAIAKHCPQNLIAGGMRGDNRPKAKSKKKMVDGRIEQLQALLVEVIKRLMKYEPDASESARPGAPGFRSGRQRGRPHPWQTHQRAP